MKYKTKRLVLRVIPVLLGFVLLALAIVYLIDYLATRADKDLRLLSNKKEMLGESLKDKKMVEKLFGDTSGR